MILGESHQQFASPGEALEHYGVKGMRWGERKAEKTETVTIRGKTKKVTPKKAEKLDKRWERKQNSLGKHIERFNEMSKHINDHLEKFNNDPRWKDKDGKDIDLNKDHVKADEYHTAYDKEVALPAFHHAVRQVHDGTSPTGKLKVKVEHYGDVFDVVVVPTDHAKHAASPSDEVFKFKVKRNAQGYILSVEPQLDSVVQAVQRGSEFLEHHGIKGMKWGVRNNQRGGSGKGKSGDPVSIGIGAVYVGLFLAAAYKTVRDIRRYKKDDGKHIQEQTKNTPWKKNANLSKKGMDVKELEKTVVKPVNRDFPKSGTKMNCRRCTFTYEMRRRGNDVTATKSHFAMGQDTQGVQTATMTKSGDHQSIWGQTRVMHPKAYETLTGQQKSEAVFASLGKQPNGARGELGMQWKFGGGHSMAYEVVNNKPVIFDTQVGKTYRTPKDFADNADFTREVAHTRLDNANLDENYLRRWMINAD